MKAMIVSDFAVLRSAILQLLGICAIIALFMGYAMGTLVGGAAAIAAMPPFMLLFSLAATDEQNNWERFRLTLPLTRRQVVFGRYASLSARRHRHDRLCLSAVVSAFGRDFLHARRRTLPERLTPAENPPATIVGSPQ
ncbi:MAG: ABC-2 transporter permease [Adlercreutzia sp.]